MGAGIAAKLSQVMDPQAWAQKGRGPKLRQLFGAYSSQDCWAVNRKFRQIDDGNGYVSYEELRQVVHLSEFNLLFIWDVFSQQDEFIDSRELLTMICVFSSASLEDKGRFLISLFDALQCGLCTGAEIGQICLTVLSALAKCTSAVVKAKDVAAQVKASLPEFVPACGVSDAAFTTERIIGNEELEHILGSISAAYEELPLSGPPPAGAVPPPPPEWSQARATDARPARTVAAAPRSGVTASTQAPARSPRQTQELSHLSWLSRLDEGTKEEDTTDFGMTMGSDGPPPPTAKPAAAPAHLWMVIHNADFATVAKDLPGFHRRFERGISAALGLPASCVEVLNVSHGSIVAEFLLRAAPCGKDTRGPSALVLCLEQQLQNPHSALRKGQLANYAANAELLAGEPKRVATPLLAKGGDSSGPLLPVSTTDQATQTDEAELALPSSSSLPTPSQWSQVVQSAAEEDLATLSEIQAVLKELKSVRRRIQKAESNEKALLMKCRERDALLAESNSGGPLGW